MSDTEGIICRTYTAFRRHEKVVGVIAGNVMPATSTTTQMVVVLVSALLLVKTRGVWGGFVPIPLQVLLVVGVPIAGWFAVKYWHPEGRSPGKAAIGALAYVSRPRLGSANGRALSRPRGVVCSGRVFCGRR